MRNKQRLITFIASAVIITTSLLVVLIIIPSRELPDASESRIARELAVEIKKNADQFGVEEVLFEAKKGIVTVNVYSGEPNLNPRLCLSIPQIVIPAKLACKKLIINCFNKREMRSARQRNGVVVTQKIVTNPVLTIEIFEEASKCQH
ncbi:MAG: hypothetical protein V5B32_09905 [Candidatus Accumulibacter sp. UW26]|jgi:hypothetical protein